MRYHAQNIVTGEWLDHDVPLSNVSLTWDLSGPSGLTASVSRGFAGAAPVELLAPWGVAIYPEESGQIRGGFLVVGADPTPESLALTCVGFAGYPQGMIWTSSYQSPDAGVDPFDVVKMIWQHLQGQPDGDLGVTIVTSPAHTDVRLGSKAEFVKFHAGEDNVEFTAQDRYQLRWWDSVDCGQEIDKLAQETPFDYVERHGWGAAGTVWHRVELGYPRLGRRRSDLRFVLGENLAVVPLPSHSDEYATEVIALGAGEGAAMLRATAGRRNGRLRRTLVLPEKDVQSKQRLAADAQRALASSQETLTLGEVDVWEHPNAPLAAIEPGDEIRVQGDLGWTVLDTWRRVTSITTHPDSGDPAQLSLRTV